MIECLEHECKPDAKVKQSLVADETMTRLGAFVESKQR
jgi:hypothetical protein